MDHGKADLMLLGTVEFGDFIIDQSNESFEKLDLNGRNSAFEKITKGVQNFDVQKHLTQMRRWTNRQIQPAD